MESVRIWSFSGRYIQSISRYPVQMQENAAQKNSKYGHFLHSDDLDKIFVTRNIVLGTPQYLLLVKYLKKRLKL